MMTQEATHVELSTLAKIVTLLVLLGTFVGTVLVTPRIWKAGTRGENRKNPGAV
jgi:hypothetical protein